MKFRTPASIRRARNLGGLSGSSRMHYICLDATGLEAVQNRTQKPAATATSGGRIHDREIVLRQGVVLTISLVLAVRLRGGRPGLEADDGRPFKNFPDLLRQRLALDFH